MKPRSAALSGFAVALVVVSASPIGIAGQTPTPARPVTFTKDIGPILQRSCQGCHRPNSLAPMSLITYVEVRPGPPTARRKAILRTCLPR